MLVLYAEVLKMFNTTQIYNQYKYYQYIKMQKKIIYSDFEKGCLFYTIENAEKVKTLKLIEKK